MNGLERIAAERQRQIDREGWTAEHDDEHTDEGLAMAAALYAAPEPLFRVNVEDQMVTWEDPWPWFDKIYPPRGGEPISVPARDKREQHSRIRRLEIAGALISAEIDRLLRTAKG